MDVAAEGSRILFTAPWDPIVVRRGDALGLRAFTDQLADAVAPGLSNRIRDARWVTILAWCLARSHDVFHAAGGRGVVTREQQGQRYAWLRPIELMWMARTIALADDWKARSLAGQRSVLPWYKRDEQKTERFGMSPSRFRGFRQAGMYGRYRRAFRRWPGMTAAGNGWTPAPAANRLAVWLDDKLGAARPSWPLHVADGDDLSTRSVKLARGDEHRWWHERWRSFDTRGRNAVENTLPRRKDDFGLLPEASLLKPLVFGSDPQGARRLKVAREVAAAAAADHGEICEWLADSFPGDKSVVLLPSFARLADAGMEVMDVISVALQGEAAVTINDVARGRAAAAACAELADAASAWRSTAKGELRHIEAAHRFASAVTSGRPADCIRAVLAHHELHGGGLRWFVLRGGKIVPRAAPRVGSSRYRFRLWSLCRIATQCGVLRKMPAALLDEANAEDEADVDDE